MSSFLDPTDGPLTQRQIDILKVPPIIWDSLFGGFLYAIRVADENIKSNPAAASQVLADLTKDLEGMRTFLIKGDTEKLEEKKNG